MRLFLFELSPQGIIIMNLSTKHVQLVLSHHLKPHSCSGICSRHDFQCMFFIQIYRCTCACPCTPLGSLLTTRWWVSDSPGSACPDPRAWRLRILPVADQRCTVKAWIIGRPSESFPSRPTTQLSSFPLVTREHFLYCSYLISLCILAFIAIGDVISL